MAERSSHGFEPGALYNRKIDIHERFGGQPQGGISTPASFPLLILFTGEEGKGHGYDDFWDDEGYFHYYGEGRYGDMELRSGNLAVADQPKTGKEILLFQSMGKGKPYRFVNRFDLDDFYTKEAVPDTNGNLRRAIVFKLKPFVIPDLERDAKDIPTQGPAPETTSARRLIEVRTKQYLFRSRLERIEKGCRITKISDTRFLRASHIKPWSKCTGNAERIDGNNGLLLAPHVDVLFDDGWISFTDSGNLLLSDSLPLQIVHQLGLTLRHGQACGKFNEQQKAYLAYHRENEFRKVQAPK